jgi:hypothetical protein
MQVSESIVEFNKYNWCRQTQINKEFLFVYLE